MTADSPRKCTHLVCPCCGVPYLSDGEVSVVVALYAASSAISISDIARVTGAVKRTVHRVVACIIESPFKGANKAEESRNVAYLNKCIRWCVENGFTPYASHKMLTSSLDDNDPKERSRGIEAGLNMSVIILDSTNLARVFFFLDYGQSGGMKAARGYYEESGFEERLHDTRIGKL